MERNDKQTNTSQLCSKCKRFFGNPQTNNMCSMCYKTHLSAVLGSRPEEKKVVMTKAEPVAESARVAAPEKPKQVPWREA